MSAFGTGLVKCWAKESRITPDFGPGCVKTFINESRWSGGPIANAFWARCGKGWLIKKRFIPGRDALSLSTRILWSFHTASARIQRSWKGYFG